MLDKKMYLENKPIIIKIIMGLKKQVINKVIEIKVILLVKYVRIDPNTTK